MKTIIDKVIRIFKYVKAYLRDTATYSTGTGGIVGRDSLASAWQRNGFAPGAPMAKIGASHIERICHPLARETEQFGRRIEGEDEGEDEDTGHCEAIERQVQPGSDDLKNQTSRILPHTEGYAIFCQLTL